MATFCVIQRLVVRATIMHLDGWHVSLVHVSMKQNKMKQIQTKNRICTKDSYVLRQYIQVLTHSRNFIVMVRVDAH